MLDDEEEAMAEALASLPPFTEQEYLTSCQDQENELAELESLVWAKKSPKSLNSEQNMANDNHDSLRVELLPTWNNWMEARNEKQLKVTQLERDIETISSAPLPKPKELSQQAAQIAATILAASSSNSQKPTSSSSSSSIVQTTTSSTHESPSNAAESDENDPQTSSFETGSEQNQQPSPAPSPDLDPVREALIAERQALNKAASEAAAAREAERQVEKQRIADALKAQAVRQAELIAEAEAATKAAQVAAEARAREILAKAEEERAAAIAAAAAAAKRAEEEAAAAAAAAEKRAAERAAAQARVQARADAAARQRAALEALAAEEAAKAEARAKAAEEKARVEAEARAARVAAQEAAWREAAKRARAEAAAEAKRREDERQAAAAMAKAQAETAAAEQALLTSVLEGEERLSALELQPGNHSQAPAPTPSIVVSQSDMEPVDTQSSSPSEQGRDSTRVESETDPASWAKKAVVAAWNRDAASEAAAIVAAHKAWQSTHAGARTRAMVHTLHQSQGNPISTALRRFARGGPLPSPLPTPLVLKNVAWSSLNSLRGLGSTLVSVSITADPSKPSSSSSSPSSLSSSPSSLPVDLSPLASLPALSSLYASGNPALTSLPASLARSPTLTSLKLPHNGFTALPAGLWPALQVADLSSNAIQGSVDVSSLASLVALDLGGNSNLTEVTGLSSAPLMTSLSVYNASLTALPNISGNVLLETLSVAGNSLSDLTLTSWAPSLRVLSASGNQLTSLGPLTLAPNLTDIDVSFNSLAGSIPISVLGATPALSRANFSNNPLASAPGYRIAVLAVAPSLNELDNNPVEPDESEAAASLRSASRAPSLASLMHQAPLTGQYPAPDSLRTGLWPVQSAASSASTPLLREASMLMDEVRNAHDALASTRQAARARLRTARLEFRTASSGPVPEAETQFETTARASVAAADMGAIRKTLWSKLAHWTSVAHRSTPGVAFNSEWIARKRGQLKAALVIQRAWRDVVLRQAVRAMREAAAATTISAAFRGWSVRRSSYVAAALAARRTTRANAASKIAAAWKGHVLRGRIARIYASAKYVDEDEEDYSLVDVDSFLPSESALNLDAPEGLDTVYSDSASVSNVFDALSAALAAADAAAAASATNPYMMDSAPQHEPRRQSLNVSAVSSTSFKDNKPLEIQDPEDDERSGDPANTSLDSSTDNVNSSFTTTATPHPPTPSRPDPVPSTDETAWGLDPTSAAAQAYRKKAAKYKKMAKASAARSAAADPSVRFQRLQRQLKGTPGPRVQSRISSKRVTPVARPPSTTPATPVRRSTPSDDWELTSINSSSSSISSSSNISTRTQGRGSSVLKQAVQPVTLVLPSVSPGPPRLTTSAGSSRPLGSRPTSAASSTTAKLPRLGVRRVSAVRRPRQG